jgi:hypothetical protein
VARCRHFEDWKAVPRGLLLTSRMAVFAEAMVTVDMTVGSSAHPRLAVDFEVPLQ